MVMNISGFNQFGPPQGIPLGPQQQLTPPGVTNPMMGPFQNPGQVPTQVLPQNPLQQPTQPLQTAVLPSNVVNEPLVNSLSPGLQGNTTVGFGGGTLGPDGFPVASQPAAQPGLATPAGTPTNMGPFQQTPQAQTFQPPSQPFGLSGAEQALATGATGAAGALQTGANVARGDILQAGSNALGQLAGGVGQIQAGTAQGIGSIQGAAQQGQGLISGGVNQATGTLGGGQQQGLNFLQQGTAAAEQPLTGFQQSGEQANQLQAALTGALGPEAQAQAFQNFQESPGQQFFRDQQEQALLRNASATGGLGGGRIRTALQEAALGRAAGQFDTRINQLSNLGGQGLQAGGQISQLRGNEALTGTNLIGQTAGQQAGIEQAGAFNQAQIAQQAGSAIAGLAQSAGFAQADVASKAAQIEQSTGVNLANIAQSTGANVGQILENLGSSSAGIRTQAGRDLANAIGQTSAGLANLQAGQGAGIADIVGGQVSNIGNLLLSQGLTDSASQQQQATILANLATGQGSVAANVAQNIGQINAAGILGQNQAAAGAIGSLANQFGDSDFLAGLFNSGDTPANTATATNTALQDGGFGTPAFTG